MKSSLRQSLALCAILLTATIAAPPAMAASRETIAMSVGRLLEEGHYTRQKLNEDVSRKFLQTYLEMLDFSHLFFTQKDVDELNAKYGSLMAGDVLLGNLKPAYEIYALYTKRLDDRVAKIKELLKQPIDFKGNATVELSRQKSSWPKDEAEADQDVDHALVDRTRAEIAEVGKQHRGDHDHPGHQAGGEEAEEDDKEAADQCHEVNPSP